MKRFSFVALPLVLMSIACDGPKEKIAEQKDDVVEAQGEVLDANSDLKAEQADVAQTKADVTNDSVDKAKLEQKADDLNKESREMENKADGI